MGCCAVLDCEEAWRGIWSIRYMRIKPRIRESPIQACGERSWVCSSGVCSCGAALSEVASAEINPGWRSGVSECGGCEVTRGSVFSVSPAGITGPGISLNILSATSPLSQYRRNGCAKSAARTSSPLLRHRTSSGAADICRRWCVCVVALALYSVSTPSGMMTISDVPTKTPMPIVDIRRSRDWDRENERGRAPAKKDLEFNISPIPQDNGSIFPLTRQPSQCSRRAA